MSGKKCGLHWVAWVLVFIGAINWGLIGVFNWNLVNAIFGSVAWLERLIYILVGLAALVMLFTVKGCAKCEIRPRAGGSPSA